MKAKIVSVLRVLAWVLALALCCLPPIFTATAAGYLPLLTLLVFSGISLWYLLGLRKHLKWQEEGRISTCTRGDNMDFGLTLTNTGWQVYPYVRAVLTLSDLYGEADSRTDTVMTLAPHESRTLAMEVTFPHIGEYAVALEQLHLRGLLGVLCLKQAGSGVYHVAVRPHIWHIASLPLSQQVIAEDSRAHTSSNIDGMDYIGVRAYEMGDQIKNIHWKLSAHSNTYMTKLTETLGTTGLTVIPDLYTDEADTETRSCLYDALVEGALSLCRYALDHSVECDLTFHSRRGDLAMRQVHQGSQLEQLFFELPPITNQKQQYRVESLLEHAARGLYVKNNVALVTSQLSPEAIHHLIRIRHVRRNPMVLLVLPEGLSERERAERLAPMQQLSAAEIPWFAFSDPKTLEGGRL